MKSWRCSKVVLKVHSGSDSTYRCWTVCQGQLSVSLMLLANMCTYSHSLAHSVFMERTCPTVRPHLSDAQRRMTALNLCVHGCLHLEQDSEDMDQEQSTSLTATKNGDHSWSYLFIGKSDRTIH